MNGLTLIKLKHEIEKKGFSVQIISNISPYYLRKMFDDGYKMLMIKPKTKEQKLEYIKLRGD